MPKSPETHYIILGPPTPEGEEQYWDASQAKWIESFDDATKFKRHIILGPFPPAYRGILEFSIAHDGAHKLLGFYEPLNT